MELQVKCKSERDLTDFMNYLLPRVKQMLLSSIDEEKIRIRDDKVNELLGTTPKRRISSLSVVKTAIVDLEWKQKSSKLYIIDFSKTHKLYGSTETLSKLVRLIEYGAKGLPPLNFFRDRYKVIDREIPELFESWKEITE